METVISDADMPVSPLNLNLACQVLRSHFQSRRPVMVAKGRGK